ncbi:MobC family plasmid mobilization relaxosome protein [Prevotellaceae bacterium LKV-178-WT-2A]|uniref:MobC family plasmid mobilization relaxosome protein n=2 Tax=Hallella mizrahii TaxID=2606637 RepID=A0A7K0KIP7_9BACT|nr:MobC family plasmid mobilization relaxosome protein [Hallella mizrahii]
MPFVMTTATCPPSRAGNQFARNSLTLSLDILITIYTMSKNITQNKTEFIQFRLDRDSKITAKALAEKYFDGKMSAMFRYMLNNTDLTKMYNTTEANGFDRSCNATFAGGSSTQEVVDWLRSVYEEYKTENRELSAIGNNINQIAHHVNANAMTYPNPLTRQVADDLGRAASDLSSLRSQSADRWKKVKSAINHQTD